MLSLEACSVWSLVWLCGNPWVQFLPEGEQDDTRTHARVGKHTDMNGPRQTGLKSVTVTTAGRLHGGKKYTDSFIGMGIVFTLPKKRSEIDKNKSQMNHQKLTLNITYINIHIT